MRPYPDEPPEIEKKDVFSQARKYRLITPLFGGSAQAGVPNPEWPIRGSSIRGHLRFWWRATRAGRFNGDLEAMKNAEQALFGSAATATAGAPSKITITIKVEQVGALVSPDVAPPYAAFPLREQENVVNPTLLDDVTFTLNIFAAKTGKHILADTDMMDLEACLWAWETFGGIGARTRRGFGALELDAINGDPVRLKNMSQDIDEGLSHHVLPGIVPNGVPHLTQKPRYHIFQGDWHALIEKYQDFRQRRTKKYGRSLWPEPDAIRDLTGQSDSKHRIPITTVNDEIVDKFPRSAFGLPIIFHFKDRADPSDTMLLGEHGDTKYDRLSSPLILRPLPGGGSSIAIALTTRGENLPLSHLQLSGSNHSWNVDGTLTPQEASGIRLLNPNKRSTGETDVLQAFFNYL